MTAPAFVDTNLLLYAYDATEEERQPKARRWLDHLWRDRAGRTIVQVLQEFYVNATRPKQPMLSVKDAREVVRGLVSWRPLRPDGSMLVTAWDLQDGSRSRGGRAAPRPRRAGRRR